MKNTKKQILGMGEVTLIGTGMSTALGGIRSTNAVHGQEGIVKATSYMPSIGTMVGAGMLVKAIDSLDPYNKRKNNRRKIKW